MRKKNMASSVVLYPQMLKKEEKGKIGCISCTGTCQALEEEGAKDSWTELSTD